MILLTDLLQKSEVIKSYGELDVEISSITDDSRKVKDGGLFIAVKGHSVDGHDYIKEAVDNGAKAIIGQVQPNKEILENVVYVHVKDSRDALGYAASGWNGHPSKKLKVVGITGTKGKSTTAYILHYLLEGAGKKVGSITSISAKIGDQEYSTGLHVTNPGPIKLHGFLKKMVDESCEYAILEVTSHGLHQKRVAGVDFNVGILTNIAHEHLDYHKTFENYKKVKSELFKAVDVAVLNKDDDNYDFVSSKVKQKTKVITYSEIEDADILVKKVVTNDTMKMILEEDSIEYELSTALIGDYNALNFAAAILLARHESVSWEKIISVTKQIATPPGRLEKIKNDKGINIYIDFAHTPDSLEKVLHYLRDIHDGRLISVFGCASERDLLKRPMMGEISTRLADVSIFTAEDPRKEDVNKIIDDIEKGVIESSQSLDKPFDIEEGHYYVRVPERLDAIAIALNKIAQKGDTVVVCGKGHEQSMSYEGVEHPWSDKNAILAALKLQKNKAAVVLAAGKGTRLKGEDAKVLRKLAGKPMITYVTENLIRSGFENIRLVVGYKKEDVIKRTCGFVDYVVQEEQLGTGHALKCSLDKIPENVRDFVVLNGDDSAFFDPNTINKIYDKHINTNAMISFVSLIVDDPSGLGRVVKGENGQLLAIVEEKDATEKQKQINEVNDGFYVFNKDFVKNNINKVQRSRKSGEYYIVDLVKLALEQGDKVNVHTLKDNNEWHGINTLEQLEEGDRMMREKISNSINGD